jgi:capsular polysaccharide export protein
MGKREKLLRDPVAFFRDMRGVRHVFMRELPFEEEFDLVGEAWKTGEEKPVALLFGFSPWKRECVARYLPEFRAAFVNRNAPFYKLRRHLDERPNGQIIVWGHNAPKDLVRYGKETRRDIWRVEDGFVRSVGLGAHHHLPYSLVIDKRGIYFDARSASDLEDILNGYDFAGDPALLTRARACMDRIAALRVSKYNHAPPTDAAHVYPGDKRRKRVLVVGQVEDDASVIYGCAVKIDNAELLRTALRECRDADVFYKPHPDVAAKRRKKRSAPERVRGLAGIVGTSVSVPDALQTVDHVYTISSLSGCEALTRGIKVTCLGAPFYAGWGLTDDRQSVPRRRRTLTAEALFAGAYLLYPRYRDITDGAEISLEQAIERIAAARPIGSEAAISDIGVRGATEQ